MNKFVVAVCLAASGTAMFTPSAFAGERDYIARMNEEGLYCARVQIQTVGLAHTTRTKCRTLTEWEEAGYVVSMPEEAGEQ